MPQTVVGKKSQDVFFWILIFYLFLELVRPADVYSFLASIRIQFVTMFFLFLFVLFSSGRKIISNNVNFFVFLFSLSLCLSSLFSLNSIVAWNETFKYIKLVILYYIIIYCIKDSFYLKSFVLCLFLLVFLYVALSFREFLLGKHVYTMGVTRMMGWDGEISPNRLGLMCVVFLPYSFLMLKKESYIELVFLNWKTLPEWAVRLIAKISIILSVVCVILTNSRSSLVLVFFYSFILFYRSKKKILLILSIAVLIPFIVNALPDETRNRYMSILYSAGIKERITQMSKEDEWAETSAQGRIFGLIRGLELYSQYPLFGVGPGGFKYVSGNDLQAHNLLGQTASEVGTLGLFSFVGILFCTFRNLKKKRCTNQYTASCSYENNLIIATKDAFLVLLIGSFFGHTLFYSWWLFLGAVSVLRFKLHIPDDPGRSYISKLTISQGEPG